MDSKDLYDELHKSVYGRVNVMTRQTENGQMVVIYDDHRWLLNVLFYLYKLGEQYDLIYFDAHDDAAECEKKTILLEKIGVANLNEATDKQFGAFVDFDQRTDDGGWLTTAMELNLIRDAQMITICREPDYCGSFGDSNRILEMLDRYYFEGCIGTDSSL